VVVGGTLVVTTVVVVGTVVGMDEVTGTVGAGDCSAGGWSGF
jgi:hypothetical protein